MPTASFELEERDAKSRFDQVRAGVKTNFSVGDRKGSK
jgi:hypothetical protein